MAPKTKDPHRFSYEGKITWLTVAAALPAIFVALALLWLGDYSAKVQWTLTILIVGCFAVFISSTREHTIRPLQTMSNLLAALREGDYSIRSEEHTSELQSQSNLVCRLLLEKKKKKK